MADRPPLRMLVIEDNPGDIRLLWEVLKDYRGTCEVTFIERGDMALGFLSSCKETQLPHLILVDLNIPRLDGRGLLKEIRAIETYNATPIIIWTSSHNPADIELAYKHRCNAYFVKEAEVDVYFTKLRTTLEFWLLAETPGRSPI